MDGRSIADDHMAAEDRQGDVHDHPGLLRRPGRLVGGGRQVAEALDGTDELGLEHRLVEEESFLGIAGEVKPSGDASHGGVGMGWVE